MLGCGEMGRVAIEDLVMQRAFERVTVGTRRRAVAEEFLAGLPDDLPTRTTAVGIDVHAREALVELMRDHDVVCNLAGPNYLNAVPVAKAAIEAGVPLVDVSDDWDATLEILDLDEAARAAGITVIVGMGASPGVTNIMARAGADRLDRTDEVRTAWIMRAADAGGPALAYHLLHTLPHRAWVYEDGRMREVVPFRDGRETLEFSELGPVEVFHIGHPEPFTLSRFIPGLRYADDKATFLPTAFNDLIVELGAKVRGGEPVPCDGREVDAMDWAADLLYRRGKEMTEASVTGALRTEVRGELDGRPTTIVYSAAGRIGIGTGVPAAIGAYFLAAREIDEPGVHPPEACVPPDAFFDEVLERNIARVDERLTQE